MRLHSPWIVAITVILVIALSMMNRESGRSAERVLVYSNDRIVGASWHRDGTPVDRWVGIVLDEAGWERLPAAAGVAWTRLGSGAAPDFENEAAIVAYLGAMPTGGYAISVREAQFTGVPGAASGPLSGRLTITLWVTSPGPDDFVTQAFTYPVDIVRVPRSAWPEGALEGLAAGTVDVIVVDQDGRNWGPAYILSSDGAE